MLIVIVILSSMIISRFGLRTKPLSIVYLAAVLAAFRFETILVRRFAHFSSASLFSASYQIRVVLHFLNNAAARCDELWIGEPFEPGYSSDSWTHDRPPGLTSAIRTKARRLVDG